jgi:transposase
MAYLESVSVESLHRILTEVDDKRAVQRLLAGIAYKDGVSQTKIARRHDVHPNTVRNWLRRLERLEDEPFEAVVYDESSGGRSRKLSDDEYERFVDALHGSPADVGFDERAWTVPLARRYLEETFDVEYCPRHVRRLLSEAGLTCETVSVACDDEDEDGQRRTVWTPERS